MDMSDIGNMVSGDSLEALKDKVQFPATKQEIVEAVNKIPDIPEPVKELIQQKLPDKQYGSLDDIKSAVGM